MTVKISELPVATEFESGDVIPIVQDGSTKQLDADGNWTFGAIDGTPIGGSTPSTGAFTSVNIDGGNIDGTAIGANSADEGNFTTLDASGNVNFDLGTLFVDASADAVGIGTTSPSYPFHLFRSGSNGTAVFERSGGQAAYVEGQDDKVGFGAIGSTPIVFANNTQERMRIDSNGNVVVGKTAINANVIGCEMRPGGQVTSTRSNASPLFLNRKDSDGDIAIFQKDGTNQGTISVSGTTVSYNGGHLSRWSRLPSGEQDASILKGTVMTNLDAMVEWEGEDNEQLNQMSVSSVEGDRNVSGVFVNWNNDDDWNDMNIAMTGDMIIRIGTGVTVQRGELLMSAGDGTAKPQGDDVVKSKTIAKVTSTHVTCTYDDGSYCVPCVLMAC